MPKIMSVGSVVLMVIGHELTNRNVSLSHTHVTVHKGYKLATLVKGDRKFPFSIATTPRYTGGCYSIP